MNINDKFKKLRNPVLEEILRDTTVKCTAVLSDNQEIMNYLDSSSKEITDPKQKALIEKLLSTRYNATADFISGINSLHEALIKLDKCDSAYQTYLEKFFPNEVKSLSETSKEVSKEEIKKVLDNEPKVESQEQPVNQESVSEEVVSTPEQETTPTELPQEEVPTEMRQEVPEEPVQEAPAETQPEVEVTPISEEATAEVEEVPTAPETEEPKEQPEVPEEAVSEVTGIAPQEVELPPEEVTEAAPELPTEGPVPLQPLSQPVETASPLPFPTEEQAPVEENTNQETPASVAEENNTVTYLKETTESAKGLIVTDKQLGNLKASKESQKELMAAAIKADQTPQNTEIPEDILDKINELYMSGKTEEAQELSNKVLTKK